MLTIVLTLLACLLLTSRLLLSQARIDDQRRRFHEFLAHAGDTDYQT